MLYNIRNVSLHAHPSSSPLDSVTVSCFNPKKEYLQASRRKGAENARGGGDEDELCAPPDARVV